jgi:F-type H+-transporting ATPase subunit b
MSSRIARIFLIVAAIWWPSRVLATEGEQAEGSWFALIFYAINFLLFLLIVRTYGWPRITQFFRNRSRLIRDNRGRAEKAYQEAQELANRATQQLRQLEADQHRMTAEMDEETTYQVSQINQAAQDAVGRIRRDAELTAAALREGAQRRLRRTMAEAAGMMARALVSGNFKPSDQERLLQGFVESIGVESRP